MRTKFILFCFLLFAGIASAQVKRVAILETVDKEGKIIKTVRDVKYGTAVTAAVARGNVMGCQFHPEKSGRVGLNILRAFCELEATA